MAMMTTLYALSDVSSGVPSALGVAVLVARLLSLRVLEVGRVHELEHAAS